MNRCGLFNDGEPEKSREPAAKGKLMQDSTHEKHLVIRYRMLTAILTNTTLCSCSTCSLSLSLSLSQ